MLESYWPTEEQIKYCIRTEAEELAEHVLLAVHEPMTLTRRAANSTEGERKTEKDILNHILKTERPIPIIGESGIGKSHLVRWLDARLRMHPECTDWHIRRIPKNASLGQVLEILLEGLEGDEFELARKRIHEVRERLQTREVADHLIVFTSHRLDELWEEAKKEIDELKKNGMLPDEETRIRIQRIQRHAKRDALPALIGDIHYKKRLVEKGKCIYQIAHRLAKGSSDEELATSDYQIKIEDLDFNLNLGDLSSEASKYVNAASLNTMPERRQEATDLLNEVLNDACRKAFQTLFQFHGGSFQELFQEIRRYLKHQNKTMVVLVEDMAAISAIEDVLIDSLMQEGVRDGKEELCSLRSVIAVTDGYGGYLRRRNTLATRAQYEWYIEKSFGDSEETYSRIEDFCGRYLNAARHGKDVLKKSYNPHLAITEWPTIWHSPDAEEKETVEAFGVSRSGHPLFPYNSASLRALADKYCRPVRDLEFNPRKILGHIMIDVLSNYRVKFCKREFPPIGFQEIECPATLAIDISTSVYDETKRAQTTVAIWGYGAEDIRHLAGIMKPPVARVFSLDDLFNVLDGTTPIKTRRRAVDPYIPKGREKPKGDTVITETSEAEKLRKIAKDVDEWFKNKSIPQKAANIIRLVLGEHIHEYWKSSYAKWMGMKEKELPSLKKGRLTLVKIPFNTNNPTKTYVSFGSEKEFKKAPLRYKSFMIALLRKDLIKSWNYDDGYMDYCIYMNFIGNWVPVAITSMVEEKREETEESITRHLSAAFIFDPGIGLCSLNEKISFLCTSQEKLRESFEMTGVEAWDVFRGGVLDKWTDMQAAWLWSYAINNHALEGDLLQSSLRGKGEKEVPASIARSAQQSKNLLVNQYSSFELLEGCTEEEQFIETLKSLLNLVESLSSAAEYKDMESQLTARKYINRIKKVLEGGHWLSVKALLSLRGAFEAKSVIRALNVFESEKADDLDQLLINWQKLYGVNMPRIKAENQAQGGEKRLEIKKYIDEVISDTQKTLEKLKGESI